MESNIENRNLTTEKKRGRTESTLEICNTLILAIATLAITWCSYQGVLWNGIQTFKLGDSNKFARLAQQQTIITGQNRAMDEAIIITFVKAAIDKRQDIVDYSLRGLRPELTKVMSEWLASKPFESPAAYPHPMAMPGYVEQVKKDMAEADKFSDEAEKSKDLAQAANSNSDSYSLLTVVFGMVMFLGAITSKIARLQLRIITITAATIICIGALISVFFYMPIAPM